MRNTDVLFKKKRNGGLEGVKTRMGDGGVVVDSWGYKLLCYSSRSRKVVILIEIEQRVGGEFGGAPWLGPTSF